MAKLKLSIHAIHKISTLAPESIIINDYLKRIPWSLEIIQLELKGKFPSQKQKDLEGELLLKSIPNNNLVIALDEKGSEFSSVEFSNYLIAATKPISFIIGGAYGLSEAIKKRVDKQISLSKMTLPHILARVVLIEQIYRAYTISENHPYHK